MKIAVVTITMDCNVQLLRVHNNIIMIVTDIRGGSKVSQISCISDSTCNKNFDGEFREL